MCSIIMYGFVLRDRNSSVYKSVTEYLLEERGDDWRKMPANSASFHLMFGERNKLPFGRLGMFWSDCQTLHSLHSG